MAGRWKKFDLPEKILGDKVEKAILKGGNDTLNEATQHAKKNHPGWATRTGKAEQSIQVVTLMQRIDATHYKGVFGSREVDYFIWLEIGTRYHPGDHTLRRAADIVFPRVWDKIRAYL